ncbi:3-isopropylmalate dehydrogenase [Oceanicola granulosus HTCC2516]|uniref:3-isopropylmalate dehydrogenase n=1 Tax=Oceanicola granulosus (strain ATCC BAA-861 / DSM 15982 / KCTC 12143 / HTCC2516) TaxID=314256 RepID=Q2CF06_OCEGH|nr:isocitrate/isopropylmalate family dehydrogenase [Oceanicola granulosus]EAR51321.1 3-isopropylmalate dehydrogenase [Oceanicola granulosus HTCC2516]
MDGFEIAVFEGDGIGPEVMRPTVELLTALARGHGRYALNFETLPAGAGHYREHGVSLPGDALARARRADAILLSAMGLPEVRYPDGTEISPQIELRMELGLYAGVRPVFQFGQSCPIARFGGDQRPVDFVIVRESTEGLFYSHGKGEVIDDSEARETLRITRATSEKLFDFAFDLARQRKADGRGAGVVHCVDKANVFQAFAFFRRIFRERAEAFPDIRAEAAYVDATAMWLVEKPQVFDVLVTENMFGDILSDLGAAMMGGLGLAPSADIGERNAVFQPCHGSAPDIAGQGRANPIAMVLSAAMMLDWLGRTRGQEAMRADALRIHEAVREVVTSGGPLTPDLGGTASTGEVVAAVRDAALAAVAA